MERDKQPFEATVSQNVRQPVAKECADKAIVSDPALSRRREFAAIRGVVTTDVAGPSGLP
jgi:hypothetical protein